jgi:hypothetical protein
MDYVNSFFRQNTKRIAAGYPREREITTKAEGEESEQKTNNSIF